MIPAVPLATSSGNAAEIAPATVKRSKAATVLVDAGRGGSGSAFLIHRCGLFVTNRHVIESVPSGEPVKLVLHSGEDEEKVIEARIALVSEDDDLALLKTESDIPIEPLELKSARDAKLAELSPIAVLGYPFGQRLAADGQDYPSISINSGKISRLERSRERLTQIQYDASTNPGNSGGPMITPDGSVVGVVVSSVRGAGINFAIPADRVMALVSGPVIALYPANVPFSERYASQAFEIELLPTARLPDKTVVTLHIGGPGGKRRSFPASLQNGRFRVSAPLIEKPAGAPPLRLRIEAKLPDATVIANVDDRPVKIGDRQILLSGILAVGKESGKTKTMLARRGDNERFEKVEGVPTGLPVLFSERHNLELNLEGISELSVKSYGSEPIEAPFEVEVLGSDGSTISRKGTLRLTDPPPNVSGSTRPKKKDLFANMMGRREQDSELDVLSLIDHKKDGLGGKWQLDTTTGEIETADDSRAWLALPVLPGGDYIFTLEFVPSADATGVVEALVPIKDSAALLRFDGGRKGRASVANHAVGGSDEGVDIPSFEKGIPFRVQVMVSDGKLGAAFLITRKSGNQTSRIPLQERLKWTGDPADLARPADCPVPPGAMGIGVSGGKMRITALAVQAYPGQLVVSRELPPAIEYHPSASAVLWDLDETVMPNRVQGRELDAARSGFQNLPGRIDMSYAGPTLGSPDVGAEPGIEGEGAMRVEGERAGFQLPSHPRLWKPSFTIAFWFKADGTDDTTHGRTLWDDGGSTTGSCIYLQGSTLRAGAWDDSAEDAEKRWMTWLSAPGIKSGEWYHVALALDAAAADQNNALRLFLNGTIAGSGMGKQLHEPRQPAAVGTVLGKSRHSPDDPAGMQPAQFTGMIDAFTLHRAALDAERLKLIVGGRFGEKGTPFPAPPAPGEKYPGFDLSGRWMDMNGGEITIRHQGHKVEADGLNELVKRHWTRAEGRLRGRVINIEHFKDGRRNALKSGEVSGDANRINWDQNNYWKRLEAEEDPKSK